MAYEEGNFMEKRELICAKQNFYIISLSNL